MARTHFLISARGSYKDAELAAETWSFGVRCVLVNGQVDDRGFIPDNLTVVDDSVELDELGYEYKANFAIKNLQATFDMANYFEANVVPAFQALFSQTQISNQVGLDQIVLYPIESPTGNASEQRSARAILTPRKYGTATGSILPLEVARVISWGTSRPGPKGKGRIYLPGATTTTIDPHGNMSSATRTTLANNAKNLLEGLSAGNGLIGNWNVRPIVTGAPYERYAMINEIRVGAVLDAQRRRRRSLSEAYISVTPSY
jgi:hypothetical protein